MTELITLLSNCPNVSTEDKSAANYCLYRSVVIRWARMVGSVLVTTRYGDVAVSFLSIALKCVYCL